MDRSQAIYAAGAAAALIAVPWIVRSRSGRTLVAPVDHSVKKKVTDLIAQTTVVVFSKSYCPFCRKVKALLKELGIAETSDEMVVIELDLSVDGPELQAVLLEMTKQRTVPSVWVKGQHLGGFDDTEALWMDGKLQEMLGVPFISVTEAKPPSVATSFNFGSPTKSTTTFHVAYGAN